MRSHCGEGPTRTLRKARPMYRGQPAKSSTRMSSGSCATGGGSSGSGGRSSPPQSAAISRAMPTSESRSGRFIVGVTSSTRSTSGRTSAKRRPGLQPVGEQHDPGVVGAEPDLVLREDHPAGHLAAERPLLERPGEAGQERAGEPDGNGRARTEVPCAADDLLRVRVADVHLAELEPVCVRMRIRGDHPPDDEVREVAARVGHADVDEPVDLERRDRQPLRDLHVRRVGGDVLAEPGERRLHQNCLEKRRSSRQSSRRSGNSCRSIAMRSRPQPNAKPV